MPIVSSSWFIRGMPSVVTLSTCVSPRWKSPEPCAVGMRPTSAESGRMSVGAATVDADALLDDALADDLLRQRPHCGLDLPLAPGELAAQLGHDLVGGLVEGGVALGFGRDGVGRGERSPPTATTRS